MVVRGGEDCESKSFPVGRWGLRAWGAWARARAIPQPTQPC
jgi:hypothetical protein